MLQAKERFIELKAEHEKVIFNREKKISEIEKRARDKENSLNKELSRTKKQQRSLRAKSQQFGPTYQKH